MAFGDLSDRIKQILIEPIKFFSSLKKEKGIKSAFQYLLILSAFSTVLGVIVGQLFQNYSYDLVSKMFGFTFPKPQYTIGMIIFFAVLGYGGGLLLSFVKAGLLHVWILIFGGKGDYSKTYQLSVYSSTPNWVVGWIPFVGSLAQLYGVVLLIFGTQKVHNISRTKAILMYVVPLVVFILFMAAVLLFVAFFFKANPNLFQDMLSARNSY